MAAGGEKSKVKLERVRKGASNPNTKQLKKRGQEGGKRPESNQNQQGTERAPAGSAPLDVLANLHDLSNNGRVLNLRGRAQVLVGFDYSLVACPLPDRAFLLTALYLSD